jgi:glucosamine-6-phosphate deaminase
MNILKLHHEQIVVSKSYDQLSQVVADLVVEQLRKKPSSCFGMPVGHSFLGFYKILAELSAKKSLDWQKAKCFALDDYLETEESFTFQAFLESNLYRFTNLPKESRYNPRFQDNYDQVIADSGGLDCCLLGIGKNGHIAFNEPPTAKASWTHCVWLSDSTIAANKDYFVNGEQAASKAISMGISTILASKRVILATPGEGKKAILQKALDQKNNPQIPASFLLEHPNLLVFTDFELDQ